jgi:predicted transcriptional regulator of viral defense system
MTSQKLSLVQSLFNKESSIVSTATLRRHNIYSRNIEELIARGFITRIRQGYYVWNKDEPDMSEIILAAKLIPNGVLCLFTAVEIYELSTMNPMEIYFALPRGSVAPSLPENLRVNVRQMIDKHFRLGITETDLFGVSVKVYDIEKTVCDCFKYEREVEKSVALEVLKKYISTRNCDIQKLIEYAEIMGKKKTILPYLEAII